MAEVLVVTSGKGGVGKTTSTAALGAALAQSGEKVCVVDFDVGLRNLDLVMGAERRVVYDLINVANGDVKLQQALIRDKRIETARIAPGQSVLALGTGGVSMFAIQIAKLVSAQALVISSSDDKLARGKRLGADLTINYRRTPDWDLMARERSGGRGVDHLLEVGPALFELIGRGHVGHRAARGEIREDHLLMVAAEDVGAFRHEMHAAEDDELSVWMPADLAGELVGVADVVGELDDLVALIVMAEDHKPAAEGGPGGGNAAVHLLV